MYQGRKFECFREKHGGKSSIPDEVTGQVECCSSGRGKIVIGCDDCTVSLLDRELKFNFGFQAHTSSVLFLQHLKVDKALQSMMKDEAERIYKDECVLLPDNEAASTKDAMYDLAEFIDRELEQMTEQIKSIVQAVNANQAGKLEAADGMTPLDNVLLNLKQSTKFIDVDQ